jgi:hypothetical protein
VNAVRIALVYSPAIENSCGFGGSDLIMPPIGICSLSSYLRRGGYHSDLFDLLFELDTTVLRDDLRRPLTEAFDAARSDKGYDPAVLSDLTLYLNLNRSYIASEFFGRPGSQAQASSPVMQFFDRWSEELAGYDIVGLSAVLEEQNLAALLLARCIRTRSPKTRIVAGGPGICLDDWKEVADLVVRGDGEAALLAFVRSHDESAAGPRDSNARIDYEQQVLYAEDLDALPTPDYRPLFAKYRYLGPAKIIPLAVTRGCYWSRCLFCSFGWRDTPERCTAPYRKVSAAKVVADMRSQMQENGARLFFFSVDVADPLLLEQIGDELARTSTEIYWSAGVRAEPQLLKPGLLQKLFRSGCRALTCGYESFSQRVLDSMRKGIRAENSKRLVEGLCETGIFPNVGHFMGWPGETLAEAAETHETVNAIFRRVPGNLAERFVLVENSPIVRIGYQGAWEPLRYEQATNTWVKRGMSWSAQDRQWTIFATNFYCDSRSSCFPARADGGYGLLYGSRYPLDVLGAMFREEDGSFGLLGAGRLTFWGFVHTRYYSFQIGAKLRQPDLLELHSRRNGLRARPHAPLSKVDRLNDAYRFVLAFIGAQELAPRETRFLREVARFDYGLLFSCLSEHGLALVRVDENGELLPTDANDAAGSFEWNFNVDIDSVSRFAPADSISLNCKCRIQFHVNGFRVLDDSAVQPVRLPTMPACRDEHPQQIEPVNHLNER